jgi:hypothetical protein
MAAARVARRCIETGLGSFPLGSRLTEERSQSVHSAGVRTRSSGLPSNARWNTRPAASRTDSSASRTVSEPSA